MPYYSADQIIGKNLIAASLVPLKRLASQSSPTVFTVPVGSNVGTVFSYVIREGKLWWMFYDENGRPYYSEQKTGYYNLAHLQDQGALTVKEETELQQQEQEGGGSWLDNMFGKDFSGTAKTAIYLIGGAIALSFILPAIRRK